MPRVYVTIYPMLNSTVSNKLLFAWNFLRHPMRNASLVPTSPVASKMMLEGIDFSSIRIIVELGPGTGEITGEILKKCRTDATIILIELEPSYVKALKEKFGGRIAVYEESAHRLDAILLKHGIAKVNLIVSGLPYFLNGEVKEKLFETLKHRTGEGTIFRFFTYSPPVMRYVYRELPVRKVSFTLRNFPPMWVYGIH